MDSLNAWFTWNINNNLKLLYLVISIGFYITYRRNFLFKKYLPHIILYISAILSLGIELNFGGVFGFFCTVFPVCLFIATRNNFKVNTFRIITKWWLSILIPSLLLFGLSFIITLPNLGTIQNPYADAYTYTNYVLLIKGYYYDIRFNSIFLEPGHLGMIIALFLFAYKFDITRWEVRYLLLVELFTLSLAGYLLVVIGYVFSLIAKGKNFKKFTFYAVMIIVSFYGVAILYNNGNNLLNVFIIQRLAYDEEKGISGNNRTGEYAYQLLDEKLKKGNIWAGTQKKEWEDEYLGAGGKVFFIKYGLISIVLFAMFYLCFLYKAKDRRYVWLFIGLLVITFFQRAYPYWVAWNLPFIAGIAVNELEWRVNRLKASNGKD